MHETDGRYRPTQIYTFSQNMVQYYVRFHTSQVQNILQYFPNQTQFDLNY